MATPTDVTNATNATTAERDAGVDRMIDVAVSLLTTDDNRVSRMPSSFGRTNASQPARRVADSLALLLQNDQLRRRGLLQGRGALQMDDAHDVALLRRLALQRMLEERSLDRARLRRLAVDFEHEPTRLCEDARVALRTATEATVDPSETHETHEARETPEARDAWSSRDVVAELAQGADPMVDHDPRSTAVATARTCAAVVDALDARSRATLLLSIVDGALSDAGGVASIVGNAVHAHEMHQRILLWDDVHPASAQGAFDPTDSLPARLLHAHDTPELTPLLTTRKTAAVAHERDHGRAYAGAGASARSPRTQAGDGPIRGGRAAMARAAFASNALGVRRGEAPSRGISQRLLDLNYTGLSAVWHALVAAT